MLQLLLWPVLAVWMGVALVIGAAIVGTLSWCVVHLIRDSFGRPGELWCPTLEKPMRIVGMPRGFTGPVPFVTVLRCERWGDGRVRCAKACLKPA